MEESKPIVGWRLPTMSRLCNAWWILCRTEWDLWREELTFDRHFLPDSALEQSGFLCWHFEFCSVVGSNKVLSDEADSCISPKMYLPKPVKKQVFFWKLIPGTDSSFPYWMRNISISLRSQQMFLSCWFLPRAAKEPCRENVPKHERTLMVSIWKGSLPINPCRDRPGQHWTLTPLSRPAKKTDLSLEALQTIKHKMPLPVLTRKEFH